MKRFIVVGLGNFGSTVARELHRQGHDVIAVDLREALVDGIADEVDRAVVADGTSAETLRRAGAEEADVGIVSTGDDVAASVLAVLALIDLGVKDVVAKAVSMEHSRILKRIGAGETVFPERDSAVDLATRLSESMLLNYVRLGGGFSVQEMLVPDEWEGMTLRSLELPRKHHISVIGVHDVLTDRITVPPDPDAALKQSDTMIVAGTREALRRIARMH
jgi:trk system potassium uptake protein TrkA